MATVCVGIDIGSSKSAICALDKLTGETKYEREVATEAEAIVRALKTIGGELEVHFESGELARWMYKPLKPHAKEVCISHPKSNAYIARDPLKNDPLDARKLALLKRAGLALRCPVGCDLKPRGRENRVSRWMAPPPDSKAVSGGAFNARD